MALPGNTVTSVVSASGELSLGRRDRSTVGPDGSRVVEPDAAGKMARRRSGTPARDRVGGRILKP
jgi:hypothetical protein